MGQVAVGSDHPVIAGINNEQERIRMGVKLLERRHQTLAGDEIGLDERGGDLVNTGNVNIINLPGPLFGPRN